MLTEPGAVPKRAERPSSRDASRSIPEIPPDPTNRIFTRVVPMVFGTSSCGSPNRVPLGGFAQRDQFDEWADLFDLPTGSRSLHPQVEELLHRSLHRAAADAPAFRQPLRVVQPRRVLGQVRRRFEYFVGEREDVLRQVPDPFGTVVELRLEAIQAAVSSVQPKPRGGRRGRR